MLKSLSPAEMKEVQARIHSIRVERSLSLPSAEALVERAASVGVRVDPIVAERVRRTLVEKTRKGLI